MPEFTSNEYIEKIKKAYNFYVQSPDGQYNLFVAELLKQEYFVLTGKDLEK